MSAPIEDVTDSVFRNLAHKYGADLTFTEMARIESLVRNNQSTWDRLKITDAVPTQIQLLGANEHSLKKVIDRFVPTNGFTGFNLNLGCPSPDMIKLGYGCALIKRISKVRKLVAVIHDQGYPCTIKMRLGLNKFEKDKKVYINLIDAVDAEFFVVHTRYGSQTYAELADHSVLKECLKIGKPIVANGDIDSLEKVEFLKSLGVNGVMIGRAAVKDLAIFNRIKGIPAPSVEELRKEYVTLSEKVDSRFRYRENVLKRLGAPISTNKEEFK